MHRSNEATLSTNLVKSRTDGYRRAIVVAVGLLILPAILAWSLTERLPVSLTVTPTSVSGRVGPTLVQAARPDHGPATYGLFLQGSDPNAPIVWQPSSTADETSTSIAELIYRLGTESAWDTPHIRLIPGQPSGDRTTSDVSPRFGGWFIHPLGGYASARPGLAMASTPPTETFAVDVDLLRPRTAAGVFVGEPTGGNGLLFYFRPENRDVMWYEVRDGQWYGPIATAPYRSFSKDPVSSIQDVARLALGGLPSGATIVGAIGVLAWVANLRRRGRDFTMAVVTETGERGDDKRSFPQRLIIGARPGRGYDPHPNPLPEGEGEGPPDAGSAVAPPRAAASEQVSPVPNGKATLPPLLAGSTSIPPLPAGRADVPPLPAERADVPPHPARRADVPPLPAGRGRPQPGEGVLALPTSNVSAATGQPSHPNRLANITAALIALAGLASTLYVANTLLERIPHVQDSVAYVFQAKTFALGRLWVPTPSHPQFFTHEFILMDTAGRWFSKYPPGWPMILALGELAKAPWVVDPICAALSLVVLYRLGAEIYRPRVGLLAALLGLSAPFFLFLSGSFMSHASGLLFTLLMTWCFLRTSRSSRPILPAILTGVAFGILFLIRPFTAIPLSLPLAVYALVKAARQPRDGITRYALTVVAAIPFIAVFLAYNRVFTGNWFYPPQQLWWPFDQVGFGPDHGPWGFTPVDALNNTSRNLSELLTHAFGWPTFLTLAFFPIPFLTARARTWDWLFLAGFLGLVVGYACWWADGIMYGPRFYYEGFGFLILLTARGFDVLLGFGTTSSVDEPGAVLQARNEHRAVSGAVFALIAALIAFNVVLYLPGQLRLYHGYNYVSAAKLDAVQASGIHNAVVFADVGNQYEWWEYGMVFPANDPLLQGDVIYARDLGDAEDRKLVADFPGRTFYRLTGTVLTAFRG